MKKVLCVLIGLAVLNPVAWAKDAEYYFAHPKDAKIVMEDCDKKAKEYETNIEGLQKLKALGECKEAAIAINAIQIGDMKKAILADAKKGWVAYVDSLIAAQEKYVHDVELLTELEKLPSKEVASKVTSVFFKCPIIKRTFDKAAPKKEICERVSYLYLKPEFEKLEMLEQEFQKDVKKMSRQEMFKEVLKIRQDCDSSPLLQEDKALNELCEKSLILYKQLEPHK